MTLAILPLLFYLQNTLNLTDMILVQTNVCVSISFISFLYLFHNFCFKQKLIGHLLICPKLKENLLHGYNVEYSAQLHLPSSLIAEYANIILMSSLAVIFFWGGWLLFLLAFQFHHLWFLDLKVYLHIYLFVNY